LSHKSDAYSLRSFIEDLRKNHPEEIFEVNDNVKLDFETTAYYLNLRKRNPVLLFNNIIGHTGFTIVTNIFGSEDRFARISGFKSVEELMERWSSVTDNIPSGQIIDNRDQHSVHKIITGEKINIFDLPIPSHYEMDGSKKGFSRYITGGLTTTIDPENKDTINLSFSRIQPFERNKFAFDAGSHGHLWKHLNISKLRGERLKMTILIGTNPIFYILGASFIDNEFAKVQELFNVSFDRGHLNPIPIPRDTEIAIEAEFLPEETFEEGPFAEYVGYMGYDSTKFVAEVISIITKNDPIYYDIQPSNSSEHVNLFSIPRSSIVMKGVKESLPKGPTYRIVWPHYGGRFLALGYVENAEPGLAKQLGITVLGLDPLWNKAVFINDGRTRLDINTALINLAQLNEYSERNVTKLIGSFVISSDPTRDEQGNTAKIIFVTKGNNLPYDREVEQDSVILKSNSGSAVISHRYRDDQKVNVIVSDDIDLYDEEQVGWAIATRSNPENDIKLEKNRITILANRKVPQVAAVPREIKEKIEKKLSSLTDGIHR
jgi:UbiD family decarboxylase